MNRYYACLGKHTFLSWTGIQGIFGRIRYEVNRYSAPMRHTRSNANRCSALCSVLHTCEKFQERTECTVCYICDTIVSITRRGAMYLLPAEVRYCLRCVHHRVHTPTPSFSESARSAIQLNGGLRIFMHIFDYFGVLLTGKLLFFIRLWHSVHLRHWRGYKVGTSVTRRYVPSV